MADNNDDSSSVKLTPHTHRLLKLVQDAPTDHAFEAARLLGNICATSEASVMWEILGILVGFLNQKEWTTRGNAALAMYSVAKNVPKLDQTAFLTRTLDGANTSNAADDGGEKDKYTWLSIGTLRSELSGVIQHGKLLLARNESKYKIDGATVGWAEAAGNTRSAAERMAIQRQILAQRLGFSSKLTDAAPQTLNGIITDVDISILSGVEVKKKERGDASSSFGPANSNAAIERRRAAKRRKTMSTDMNTVLKSFLVKSFTASSNAVKTHQTSQDILATELIFNMMHEDWGVRHGAVMGALQLFRAWSVSDEGLLATVTCSKTHSDDNDDDIEKTDHSTSTSTGEERNVWGAWGEDVLARCVGVLCLDQFNDFAHYTHISTKTNVSLGEPTTSSTAPVRESAAQLLAYLYALAPSETKRITWETLYELFYYDDDDVNTCTSWYRKHGALFGIKYLTVCELKENAHSIISLSKLSRLLLDAFDNSSDDIKSESAAIIIHLMERMTTSMMAELQPTLLKTLKTIQPHSTHSANCITLLATLQDKHNLVVAKVDDLLMNLCSFLDYNSAVQYTVLRCMEKLVVSSAELSNDVYNFVAMRIFSLEILENDENTTMLHSNFWGELVQNRGHSLTKSNVYSLVNCLLSSKTLQQIRRKCGFMIRTRSRWLSNLVAILLHANNLDHVAVGLVMFYKFFEVAEEFSNDCRSEFAVLAPKLVILPTQKEFRIYNDLLTNFIDLKYEKLLKVLCNLAYESSYHSINLQSIRLKCQICCSYLIYLDKSNDPSISLGSIKWTPFIRSLMTSLKNEHCPLYGAITNLGVCRLLQLIPRSDIRGKICSNVIKTYLEKKNNIASSCLSSLVETMNVKTDLKPLFEKLRGTDEDALRLWLAILPVEDRQLDSQISMLVIERIPCIVDLAVNACDEVVSFLAIETITRMARTRLGDVVKYLTPLLNQSSNVVTLVCVVSNLVDALGVRIVNVLDILLGFILGHLGCKNASSVFGKLVMLAPLAPATVANTQSTHQQLLINHLIHAKPLPAVALPSDIIAKGLVLRNYQVEGISWLNFLKSVGVSGVLADDMGLGKTVQALCAIALHHYDKLRAGKMSLIVCPATLSSHWMTEMQRFFPTLSPLFYGGSKSERRCINLNSSGDIGKGRVVVVSYGTLRQDINHFQKLNFEYVILDEGHLLKNSKTATARATHSLTSMHKLILTGTPIQNHISELWALFEFLMPGYLNSETAFWASYGKDIVKSQSPGANSTQIHDGHNALKKLHQTVLPFILRREKSAVLVDLPAKIITDYACTMAPFQAKLYNQFASRNDVRIVMKKLDQISSSDGEIDTQILGGGSVLKALLHLRLICTHPSLVIKQLDSEHSAEDLLRVDESSLSMHLENFDASGKLIALNDLLRSARICTSSELTAADNDTSSIFAAARMSRDICDGSDDEKIGEVKNDESSVGDGIDTSMEEISTSKCLIFAQYTQSLDTLERLLFKPHMPSLRYLRLDGRVPAVKRGEIAQRFNTDSSIRVLLLTTKVGGLGLNLTSADTVIFLESDYNPHADLQAMDRVHRLGQTKSVNVYRLVTRNSIEEKIMHIQKVKKSMSDAIVNTENSSMFSIGTDRLLDLFSVEGDRNTEKNEMGDDACHLEQQYSSLSVEGFLSGMNST